MIDEACKVTVVCIAYNQEQYIAQALESFISQKTDFKFQIFVGEDRGTDGTKDIILDYAARYPGLIVPFIREENMGAQRNLIDLCRRAGTPYIALCEGDDYWLDDFKLQKQYELMEEHPEYRACFHNTRIDADQDWYLNSYYIPNEEGERCIPSSIPGYDNELTSMRMDYYIGLGPAHTSSIFYRWDNDREIPEWYYNHIYGDHSLMMIQAGDGPIGFIPETMSAYRRHEAGASAIMFENKTEHFLKSRESWIAMATDLERYFKKHYGTFANKEIQERIITEFANYTRSIAASGDDVLLAEAFAKHLYAVKLYMEHRDRLNAEHKKLNGLFTEEELDILWKNESVKDFLADKVVKRHEAIERDLLLKASQYSEFALLPKDKSIWAFSCDGYNAYSNNARYLFEYIIAFHPEIKPVWITKSKGVLNFARAEHLPIVSFGTPECTEILKRASVAFFNDSKVVSFRVKGFNKGIKMVRLGTGFHLDDTRTRARYSSPEFNPEATVDDVAKLHVGKYGKALVNSLNIDFFTEHSEDFELALAPNALMKEVLRDFLHIPEDRILVCGSPRSEALLDNTADHTRRIIFAPSIDKGVTDQEAFIDDFFSHLDDINDCLEQLDLYMDVYIQSGFSGADKKRIEDRIDQYQYVNLLRTHDIYKDLARYELMISDYSNVMYDYLLLDRPIVVFNPNREKTIERISMFYDYNDMIPGEQVVTWDDVLAEVVKCLENPERGAETRARVRDVAYDYPLDMNICETIVEEVKRRIGF
ncbi:MAG: bifunctional glycosyltransferase/CDP-glycerol:glycerophosphate glycerophosphotransferase [Coriobacteriales bacterium]|jgi:glycosyltransferase involved in cell wall biosynthesis